MFTAALESAAFIVSDINELIKIGLSKIPEDCRIAQSIHIAIDGYQKGKDWLTTREALVKDSSDLGLVSSSCQYRFCCTRFTLWRRRFWKKYMFSS